MKKQIIQHKIIPAGLMTLLVAGLVVYSTQQHHARHQLVLSAEMDGTYEAHINADDVVTGQQYGGTASAPYCNPNAPYAASCAFLTASGTMGGDAADYAHAYYENPMCHYRTLDKYLKDKPDRRTGKKELDYYKCGALWSGDFDWWAPTVWSSIAQVDINKNESSAEKFCKEIAAMLCGHNGLILMDYYSGNNGHLWAVCNITLNSKKKGEGVTVDFQIIDAAHDSRGIWKSCDISCSEFLSYFIDLERSYAY